MGDKLSASPDFAHTQYKYQIHKSMSDHLPFAIPSAPCKASCQWVAVTGVVLQVVPCLKTKEPKVSEIGI